MQPSHLHFSTLEQLLLSQASLQFVGALEARLGWKRYPMIYEVRAEVGADSDAHSTDTAAALRRMQAAILQVLDSAGQRLSVLERDNVAGLERVAFTVLATSKTHARLIQELRSSDATDQVAVFLDTEEE